MMHQCFPCSETQAGEGRTMCVLNLFPVGGFDLFEM